MARRGLVVLSVMLLWGVLPVDGGELTVWTPLVPTAARNGDDVGEAVSVDLPWLAVGAPGDGAVYLYKLVSGGWDMEQKISRSLSGFGSSIAVDDGRLAVGAPNDDRVAMFRLDGTSWKDDGVLAGPAGFGTSLDIDGDRMVIGAPGDAGYDLLAPEGQVRTYVDDGTWKNDQTLSRGGLGAETQFGADVDLDGDLLIVGAPARQIEDEVFQGAAYIFERTSSWVERAHLSVDGSFDQAGSFGHVVAISGTDAIAAAPPRIINGIYYIGHLFFYEQRGTSWTMIQSDDLEEDDVAMDGRRAVLGADLRDRARILERTGNHWETIRSLYDRDSWYDSDFGRSVALQDDKVFVGAPRQDTAHGRTGAVWTFVENLPPVAVAGEDQRVVMDDPEGTVRVTVDGGESHDPDGYVASHQWTWKGKTVKAEQTSFFLPIGTHTVKLKVWDDLGFSDSDSLQVTVVAEPKFKGSFSFSPDRRDPGTVIQFKDTSVNDLGTVIAWDWDFDGDGRIDATGHAPSYQYAVSGRFEARLTVTDHLGKEVSATRDVTVTDANPRADAGDDVVANEFNSAGQGVVTLDGSASKDPEAALDSYRWSIQGVPIGEGEQLEWSFNEGTTDVRLTVRDSAGQSSSDTVRILVPRGGPNGTQSFNSDPAASSSWGVHPDDLPRTLLFKDQSSDAETDIAFIGWDFDMDGEWDDEREEATHKFAKKGTYKVGHRAVDMDGSMDYEEFEVRVEDEAPQAAFVPERLLRVPLGAPVVFFDASTDREDPIVQWRWDLNETQSSRQDVGHVFQNPGRHNITLLVTDSNGQTAEATGFIQVFEVSEDILANWTQDQALELQAQGQEAFLLPGEAGYEEQAGSDRPAAREQADEAKADSPWRITEEAGAPEPKLWWLWILLGAVLLITVIDQSRRARRRARRRGLRR